ncbi:MAG: hypothetical protein HYX92_17285 [Chloroflexi bacterium]|nr:hypothetical protein [Chloroflexota bacterium]
MNDSFKDSLKQVRPIKLREPLADTLGALQEDGAVLEYSFIDTVKMAGHACPTVAGAYLCCQEALDKLYTGETPVRGEISVTVYGEPDEGVYGVMGQVFSFLTGAAPASGFRGLGPKFKRKDLLRFVSPKIDPEAMCFKFRRVDNGATAVVRFYPERIPFSQEKAKRLGELMTDVIWEAAKEEERKEFQRLWMGKVESMLLERKDIDGWLKLEVQEGVK